MWAVRPSLILIAGRMGTSVNIHSYAYAYRSSSYVCAFCIEMRLAIARLHSQGRWALRSCGAGALQRPAQIVQFRQAATCTRTRRSAEPCPSSGAGGGGLASMFAHHSGWGPIDDTERKNEAEVDRPPSQVYPFTSRSGVSSILY